MTEGDDLVRRARRERRPALARPRPSTASHTNGDPDSLSAPWRPTPNHRVGNDAIEELKIAY
jgi:hypothetical protein